MSVYTKLMQARMKLHAQPIKKSGHNKFAGYYYMELGDFLIPTQTIFAELGLCGIVSFTADIASLTIIDTEDGTQHVITSPMGSAALKGCHEVQNVGAVETYQRRYLWVTAMEIVEHDAIDSAEPVKPDKAARKVAGIPDDVRATPTDGAGDGLDAQARSECEELAAYLVECHESGNDITAIGVWYAVETWPDDVGEKQECKKYVWKLLQPYSKLRTTLKQNAPVKVAA